MQREEDEGNREGDTLDIVSTREENQEVDGRHLVIATARDCAIGPRLLERGPVEAAATGRVSHGAFSYGHDSACQQLGRSP